MARRGSDEDVDGRAIHDEQAFDGLWDTIVAPWCRMHATEPGVSLEDEDVSRQRLMAAYHHLADHSSEAYMDAQSPALDHRSVAACLMFATAATRPLAVDVHAEGCMEPPRRQDGSPRLGSVPFYANERLAIAVACSIVLSYLETAVLDQTRCDLTQAQRDEALRAIEGGIDLLEDRDGGAWLLGLEKALALTAIEGDINIPLMSCLVAYLEAQVLDADIYQVVLGAFERVSGEGRTNSDGGGPA